MRSNLHEDTETKMIMTTIKISQMMRAHVKLKMNNPKWNIQRENRIAQCCLTQNDCGN